MFIAHIIHLAYVATVYAVDNYRNGSWSYLMLTLKHLDITFYMLALMFVHSKVYLRDVPNEDIFEQCPPSGWSSMSQADQDLQLTEYQTFKDDLKSFRVV